MVIYFTGTGNSKYVAEAVADRLGDTVVCSNDYIRACYEAEQVDNFKKVNKSKLGAKFESDTPWVFVFPIYLSTIAEVFADFIRESTFEGNKKAYFVGTCAGSIGATGNVAVKICKSKGLEYMGAVKVEMPQNYIALFTMYDEKECKRRQENALLMADKLANAIKDEKPVASSFISGTEYVATSLVEKMYNGPFTKTRKFYATDECVGCKKCEKICPLSRIKVVNGKPVWHGNCTHCMACINSCPKEAIEYGKGSVGKRRYNCVEYKN